MDTIVEDSQRESDRCRGCYREGQLWGELLEVKCPAVGDPLNLEFFVVLAHELAIALFQVLGDKEEVVFVFLFEVFAIPLEELRDVDCFGTTIEFKARGRGEILARIFGEHSAETTSGIATGREVRTATCATNEGKVQPGILEAGTNQTIFNLIECVPLPRDFVFRSLPEVPLLFDDAEALLSGS